MKMPANMGEHVRTALVGVTTGGILWIANSVADTRAVVAGLTARMNGISGQMSTLTDAIKDAAANAMPRDVAQQQIATVTWRIDRIDKAEQEDAKRIEHLQAARHLHR